jgi:hypothetical protein
MKCVNENESVIVAYMLFAILFLRLRSLFLSLKCLLGFWKILFDGFDLQEL